VFFRNVKFWQGKQQEAPPIFHLDGVNYMWLKKNGLFFVVCNKVNISPVLVMEFLNRLTKVFKDYCGVLTEESIRSNFVLLYELLDELVDFGYVQDTSSEMLKNLVFNEAVAVKHARGAHELPFKLPDMNPRTTPSTAVDEPIAARRGRGDRKNEIFVDIFERVSVTFSANGYVLNSSIDGAIQMKSYLQGNPELRLALNEELVVGKGTRPAGVYNAIEVDDCNFHQACKMDMWDSQRVLALSPPDGEFTVMNYRITSEFRTPFRIFPFFELVSPTKVELEVKVRADIPEQNYGANVLVEFPVPKSTANVSCDLGVGVMGQSTEYNQKERKVQWKIKKIVGGTELMLRARITLSSQHTVSVRKEIGPISMTFEIPMYNPSNIQVKYLRLGDPRAPTPHRWVRYVTRSNSYVCRL
jgi:AP-4 complex subunit mu-1